MSSSNAQISSTKRQTPDQHYNRYLNPSYNNLSSMSGPTSAKPQTSRVLSTKEKFSKFTQKHFKAQMKDEQD